MEKFIKRTVTIALVVLGVGFFSTFCWNPAGTHMGFLAYQMDSVSRMRQMALAVMQYQSDRKGSGLDQLADLYPEYISEVSLFMFQSTYSTSVKPPDNPMGSKEVIPVFSPYVYMPLADGRFVIFERPGFWRDAKVVDYVEMDDKRPNDTSSEHHPSIDNFEHLLGEGFPEVSGSTSKPAGQ